MSLQQRPADWYDDPKHPGMLRYWDGETWTDHTMPATADPALSEEDPSAADPGGASVRTPARVAVAVTLCVALVLAALAAGFAALGTLSGGQESALGKQFESLDCAQLADEAIGMSQDGEERLALREIRDSQAVTDNTATVQLPATGEKTLVLACRGLGVWADDGTTSRLRLEVTLDSSGDAWIAYNPVTDS